MASKNLPINQVVEVSITREGVAPASSNFSNLLYVGISDSQTDPKIPKTERVRTFTSAANVGRLFGSSSDIYKASEAYFGQSPAPSEMLIALRYGGASTPPVGNGKALGQAVDFNASVWNAVTGGAFSFTYNSVQVTIQNLDFSNVQSAFDVVDIINSHFNSFSSSNPNASLAVKPLAVMGENVWTNTAGEAWEDLSSEYWITHVAPTGELKINYDATSRSFYITSTVSGRDFVEGSFGAASFGTDITVNNLLNIQTAIVQSSQLSGTSGIAESSFAPTFATVRAISKGVLTIGNTSTAAMNFGVTFDIYDVAAVLSINLGSALGQEVSVNVVGSDLYVQYLGSGTALGSSLTFETTALATALFGSTLTLPVTSDFLETASEALLAAQSKNNAFYGVAKQSISNEVAEKAEVISLAATVQSMTKMYFAFLYDQTIYSSSKADIGSSLSGKSFFRTVPCAVDAITDGFIDCAAAGKLLTQIPGSSTLFGKQLATVTASNQGISGQNYALGKGVNILSLIGEVSIFRNGTVAQTSPEYADVIRGIDWLTNQIEVNVFARIASARKIPYTDTGVNILKAELKKALDLAVLNGLIADDVDSNGNLVPAYTISAQRVAEVASAQRQRRVAPTIRFSARLAGAIQHVTISGTVSV